VSPTSNSQGRLLHEIQHHIQIISSALYSLSDKLTACDEDHLLGYLLNEVEEDQVSHIGKLKA